MGPLLHSKLQYFVKTSFCRPSQGSRFNFRSTTAQHYNHASPQTQYHPHSPFQTPSPTTPHPTYPPHPYSHSQKRNIHRTQKTTFAFLSNPSTIHTHSSLHAIFPTTILIFRFRRPPQRPPPLLHLFPLLSLPMVQIRPLQPDKTIHPQPHHLRPRHLQPPPPRMDTGDAQSHP